MNTKPIEATDHPSSFNGRSPRGWRKVMFALLPTLALLGMAEVTTRWMGLLPWHVTPGKVKVEPGGKLFKAHPALGYMHIPGQYRIRIPGGYTFTVTHDDEARRISHPESAAGSAPALKEIWIFGCSFTHGWTLNDEETYPWRLQQSLPEFEIVNFGVSGYGTVHSLIQLRHALEFRPQPAAIVLTYASFHDPRNTFARSRQKYVAPWNKLGPLMQPAARLDPSGNIQLAMTPLSYFEFPLIRRLALVHAIEQQYNAFLDRRYRNEEVTFELLQNFVERARAENIPILVAGIIHDDHTAQMLARLKEMGVETTDISVDLDLPGYCNLPYDAHPSALANKIYASKLLNSLATIDLDLPEHPQQPDGNDSGVTAHRFPKAQSSIATSPSNDTSR